MTRQKQSEKESKDGSMDTPIKQNGAVQTAKLSDVAAKLGKYARTPAAAATDSEPEARMSDEAGEAEPLEHASGTSVQRLEVGPELPPDEAPISEPTIADVYKMVAQCSTALTSLNANMGGLKEEVLLIRQDMRQFKERVGELEGRVSDMEDQLPPVKKGPTTCYT